MSSNVDKKLQQDVYELLKAYGTLITAQSNSYIFRCNDSDEQSIYYILDGKVELGCTYETGHYLTLRELNQGGWFGYEDALLHKPRTYDAIAKSEISAFKISADTFHDVLMDNGALIYPFLLNALEFHRNLIIRLTNTICLPAKKIVAREILRQYLDQDKSLSLEVDFKAWALYLGMRQETLSRALSDLRAEDLISSNRTSITITKLEQLSEYSAQDYEFYSA
jgi:CRP-like cAMP-binding protein